MAGRNWTRKSIEELVDYYLRKHGGGSLVSNIASSLYLTIDNNPYDSIEDNIRLLSYNPTVVPQFKVNNKYPAFANARRGRGKYMVSIGLHRIDYPNRMTTKLVEKLKDFRFRGSGAAVPAVWNVDRVWFAPSDSTVMYKLKDTASGKGDVYSLSIMMHDIGLLNITDTTGLTFNSATYGIKGTDIPKIDDSPAFQAVKEGKSGLLLFSDCDWIDSEIMGFAHWIGYTSITSVEDLDLTGGTTNENDESK